MFAVALGFYFSPTDNVNGDGTLVYSFNRKTPRLAKTVERRGIITLHYQRQNASLMH